MSNEATDPLTRIEQRLEAVFLRLDDPRPVKRWLTVANAAEYADLSEESIRRLIAAGKLTAHRPVKGRVLLDRHELDDVIRATANQRPRTGRGMRGGRGRRKDEGGGSAHFLPPSSFYLPPSINEAGLAPLSEGDAKPAAAERKG